MHSDVAPATLDYSNTDTRVHLLSICADPGYMISPELLATLDLSLFENLCRSRTPPHRICRDLNITLRDFDYLLDHYQKNNNGE